MRACRMLKVMDRQARTVVAYKTPAQIKVLLADGEVSRSCWHCGAVHEHRRCIKKMKHAWVYKATERFFQKDADRSRASLTSQDSRANAGMGGRRAIIRARLRVGWWPLIISDPRNPLPVTIPAGTMCPLDWPSKRQPLPRPV
jgi:hypothetical protein